ncbi:MAG: DUF1844 domain-containing protein [Bryobacteraceae bacterium]|jgi:hypothetical protein
MSDAVEDTLREDFGDPQSRPALPPPDFDFLIYSLRLQTEMSLGLLPFTEKREPDLELARHNIELLAMLQKKTQGNLTTEEQLALDNSLAELRFRFVQVKETLSEPRPGDPR